MVLLSKEIFQDTRNIVLGHKEKGQFLDEFSAWMKDEFDIEVLNIEFGPLTGPNEQRYRLYIIVKSAEDRNKMIDETFNYNSEYQQQISAKFNDLNQMHCYTDESTLQDLFVAFGDFAHDAKTLANWAAIDKARKIIKEKYEFVWRVHAQFERSVVFYYSTQQIMENEMNGINDQITTEYFQILQEYDECRCFQPDSFVIKFDSKENLDKHFEGNLFYYDR